MNPSDIQTSVEPNIPLDYQEALQAETITNLKAAHTDLLARFAGSTRNQYRVEIILFRSLLTELAEWAERLQLMSELAHKARWWEAYWYEREYGDSGFEDLSESEQETLRASQRLFDRHHVGLWIATTCFTALGVQMVEAAASSAAVLHSLGRLSTRPDWSDLSYAIEKASPVMRNLISQSIAICVTLVDPATYTEEFIDFLRQHDSFQITLSPTPPQVSVAINTPGVNKVVLAKTLMDPAELMAEMARTNINTEVDDNVHGETTYPIEDLFAYVQERDAA
jgi:hypothetical protein